MACKDCIYWNQESQATGFGKCHRFPPSPVVIPVLYPEGKWLLPTTKSQDWCGEERQHIPDAVTCGNWEYEKRAKLGNTGNERIKKVESEEGWVRGIEGD